MTVQEYIQEKLVINESLSFDIPMRTYKKGESITSVGTVEKNIYFIISGITKLSMLSKGEEKILDFNFPNDFVTSLTSLITHSPSDVAFTCLTDCTVQVINNEELEQACNKSLVANRFYKYFLQNYYLIRVKKEKDLFTKDVMQRYVELTERNPKLLQNVSLGLVAKYLGIHPNSLSRIRKNIVKPKNKNN